MQARVRGDLGKEIHRPSDPPHQGGKLAALELLQRGGIIVEHLLDLDAQAWNTIVPVRLDALPAGPKLTFLPRRSSIVWMSVRARTCISETGSRMR